MKEDGTLHDAMLQDAARRLGAGAAERLDVERTAQAVVARLRELLDAVDEPGAQEPVSAQDVGLEDLTPQQLRTLLASLEA